VLLVVGLGGWFVLGQQGVAPGPVAAFQQGGGSGNAPSEASTGAPGSRSGAAAAADSAAADTAGSTTADPTTEEARAYAQAGRLDRAEGGWTVVVASETSRDTARRAAQQFARQFQDQDYPIDILEATVDGTPRYRVVVGQFSSREAAAQPLQRDGGPFPQGAWTLQVEPGS
jgi:septal ring-binding cell division protein DamX